MINQLDNDEFFESELNEAPVNPLEKPEVKPKLKGKDNKAGKEGPKFGNDDLLNEILSSTSGPSDPLNLESDTSMPKVLSLKNQKGQNISPIPSDQAQTSFSSVNTLNTMESPDSKTLPTKAGSDKNSAKLIKGLRSKKANPENTADSILEEMNKGSKNETKGNESIVTEASINDLLNGSDANTVEKKGKKTAQKQNEAGNDREVKELRETLTEREEALEKYAIDNDQLLKERNELKGLADTFQHKVNTLDGNLTQMLEKNTNLENEVDKLKRELNEAIRNTSTTNLHVMLFMTFFLISYRLRSPLIERRQ